MKKDKVSSTLYYIASVLFYISAILSFVNSDSYMGVVWLALGSTFLCLGSVYKKKDKEDGDDGKQE